MSEMDWLAWFDEHGNGWLTIQIGDFGHRAIRVEDLYQAAKARLLDEIHAETEHGDQVIITTYSDDDG